MTANEARAQLVAALLELADLVESGWYRRDGRMLHIAPPDPDDCDALRGRVEAFTDQLQRHTIWHHPVQPSEVLRRMNAEEAAHAD